MRAAAIIFFFSAIGSGLAGSWWTLIGFRTTGGVAIGMSAVLIPMYLSEIAPDGRRGQLVGFFQLSVVLGILVGLLSNAVIDGLGLNESIAWRLKFASETLLASTLLIVLLYTPRSPRWLATRHRFQEARASLAVLGVTEIDHQIDRLHRSVDTDGRTATVALFSRAYAKPLALAIFLAVFNNLAGINGVMYYLGTILDSGGVGKLLSSWQSVLVGTTNLIFTVLAMRLIDKLGRRTLLLIGSIGLCPIHFAIVAVFWFETGYILLFPLTMAYFAVFAFAQASVIWVYLNEIFPSRVRDQGVSAGAFVAWSMGAAITWLFPVLSAVSPAVPFLLFGSCMIVQFVVVWLIFPETMGIEIDGVEAS